MKQTHRKKSINLETLTMYLEDLIRMGFVTAHMGKDGVLDYKLTDIGIKSGLTSLPN